LGQLMAPSPHSGETQTMIGWIIYGEALNEGRELFPRGDDRRFSDWIANANLPSVDPHDRAAAMWAAGNPEEYRETWKAHPLFI
jgi:hypothetical protein